MADMVTWPMVRELANFRAENGCATTLYLNLDPSEVPTAGDAQTRMNALLNAAEKTDRKELTHEQRSALKGDFERIARWFDDEFDRDGAQAMAVFSAGLDNFWTTIALPEPVPDRFKIGRDFFLAPLVPIVARADGTIVAVVGREQGHLYRLEAGRLPGISDHLHGQPGRAAHGGWPPARSPRPPETLGHGHLQER